MISQRLVGSLVALALSASAALAASVTVVDGDTLRLGGERVRLAGIDAPEAAQTCRDASDRPWACGAASTAFLRQMVDRDPAVTCERQGSDRYGRTIATCRNGGGDLGARLVGAGLAVAYRRYSAAYVEQEAAATAQRLGMWAGQFEMPEAYRRETKR